MPSTEAAKWDPKSGPLLHLLLISDLIEISFSDEEEEREKVAPKKELMVLVNSGEGEATVLDMREFGKVAS